MSDFETVSLTFGSQQGFHIWTNVRAHNVCFSHVTVKRSGQIMETGEIISYSQDQLNLVPASDPRSRPRAGASCP